MNVARFTISSREWGEILILRPYPKPSETWGALAPIKGTAWEELLPVVSGGALSHALHGHVTPLMQELGPSPRGLLRMVPVPHRTCRQVKTCPMARACCTPGPKTPDCFIPEGIPSEAVPAVTTVIAAWVEGRYVIIVEGAEFSL